MAERRRPGLLDLAVCAGLLLAVAVYVTASPHPLGHSDEGYFLLHTRRTLEGQAAYRDFHEQYAPLGYYLMALPLGLFGVNSTAAAATMAGVHGAILLLIYAAARSFGASAGLAGAGALLQLALCQAAWPMASGHWLAALFLAGILARLARGPLGPRALLLTGAAVAGLAGVQHQKGLPIALAVALVIVCDTRLERRFGGGAGILWPRLGRYGLAAGLVGTALLAVQAVRASPGELVDQLFVQLRGYRAMNEAAWGQALPNGQGSEQNGFASLLIWLPALLPLAAARAALAWRRGDAPEVRKLAVLGIVCTASFAATLYRPDRPHIAFVAAPGLVLLAETLQWGVRWLVAAAPRLERRAVEAALAAALILASAFHLQGVVARRRAQFSVPAQTAFGRVDFWSQDAAALVTQVLRAMDELPDRELLCYPHCASMYLLAGARNPTRYDLVFYPGQHRREQLDEILATLKERRLRYVVLQGFLTPGDPVVRYVRRHYDPLFPTRTAGTLYRRRERR